MTIGIVIKHVIKDLMAVLAYLPYGLLAGAAVSLMLWVINAKRTKAGKQSLPLVPVSAFVMYVIIMMCITFWGREGGSTNSIDMKLFSTWGINARNNAYVIENILLFMPYGFLGAWMVPNFRNIFAAILLGFVTSTGVEMLQLISGRGYFQIDDILTNALGTLLGCVLFCVYEKRGHEC